MRWEEAPDDQKALVFELLIREAERLERDAMNLQRAARQLGRPSIVERHELRADVFRAAIAALGGEADED
jgi:hypothetical protein